MRRLLVLPVLLAGLVLAPAAAQAATPGVNIVGSADVAAAAATGAKTVRVFAVRSSFPAAYPDFKNIVTTARASGMGVVFVLVGSRDGATTDPADFANFAAAFATQMKGVGGATAYEVWNEEDETDFWGAAVDAAHYSEILKAAYPRIKAADPSARVLLGPLTGNNYNFLGQIYAAGAGSSFDAAAVHTDTACLVDPPSSFYRDGGNVARFTFLGFRTVHDVMVANGDGAKPIWMTELGWTTTTTTCARGMWAGQKPSGVSEAAQAANLKEAYHCLASYPYIETAMWFTLKDSSGNGDELDHYGLQRLDGTHKPAWDAFQTVATRGDQLTGPCGDFDAPSLTISAPGTSEQYVQTLTISAVATDASSVARMTFQADGKEIRNFTGTDVASGKAVTLDWQGAKSLAFGTHTISVIALDPQGNTSTKSVQVTRVKTLPATLKTRIKLGKAKIGKGRKASISGRVLKTASPGLSGKVRVYWQQKRKGKWKTIHGGLKPANKPFTFKQKLKSAGAWRVMVKYVNVAPYKASTALSKTLRVKH
ncbi:MAG TPA: Ig-like domain-containing protein [Solirubrobacteraceae bacterium]|nr:Ig-like domain-containing protein [Solirubrobacteraceae bacterium]